MTAQPMPAEAGTTRIAAIQTVSGIDVDANLAKFTEGDRQIPIRVQLNEAARDDLSVVSELPVPTASGVAVPLSSVATIRYGQGPSSINRFNREPAIVLKDTLQWDPAIDVLLNRVPTRFVTTGRRRKAASTQRPGPARWDWWQG